MELRRSTAPITRRLATLQSLLSLGPIELSSTARRLRRSPSVHDVRKLAARRLPRIVFDFIDGAAEDELSLRWNSAAYRQLEFVPRVLIDVSSVDTATTILGRPAQLPLVLAPTGLTGLAHPAGETAAARAAGRAGIPYALSTLASQTIEQVAASNSGADLWFQVYVWRDRGLVSSLLERARNAGYRAILLTVDTAVAGYRERDVRRGLSIPFRIGPRAILDALTHPSWTWRMTGGGPVGFANIDGSRASDATDPSELAAFIGRQFDPTVAWHDVQWFRDNWDGPVVIKGIQSVSDAVRAAEVGVDAIVLSNHGGRQLDGSPAPAQLIAPVAETVGDRLEVLCDGGLRRGSDLAKAVAMGATAGMIGRPYLYGLAAAGRPGVDHVVETYRTGLERSMALAGRTSITQLEPDLVRWRRA